MKDVKSANGFIVARVDGSGNVTFGPDAGPIVGRVGPKGEIFDDDAGVHQVGRVGGDGTIHNMQHETIGKVDPWGRVYDPFGDLVGTVEQPGDAGVLMLLAQPVVSPQPSAPESNDEGKLMKEALDLAEEQQRVLGVRKDYKPLTERDLFMEHLPRE